MTIVEQIAREFAAPNEYGEFWIKRPTSDPTSGRMPRPEKGYYWRKDATLTADLLARHIAREPDVSVAVCLEWDDGGQRVARACAFDIDDHDGMFDGTAKGVALRIASACEQNDLRPLVVRSGGGAGFHVWLFFDKPRRKDVVRKFMREALASLGLKEGKGGAHVGEVECFPSAGPALIALPFARESQPFMLLDEDLVPVDDAFPVEVPISMPRKRGPRPRSQAGVDLDAAFAAFVRDKDGGDYEVWVRVGMTVKAALGEDGYRLWADWSALQPGFRGEHDTREKWDRGFRSIRIPPGAFWSAAKKNGYAGGFPDGISGDKRDGDKDELLEIVARLNIVGSNEGQAFAEVAPRVWADVKSKAVKQAITLAAYDEAGILLSGDLAKAALTYAEACATERDDFHVRCARRDGRVFYAVGDDAATIYELTASGIVVRDAPPVRFKRTDALEAAIADTGSIDDLKALVATDDDNLHVLVAFLVKALLQPDTAHPILLLAGAQGSAKSSTMETLVRAIDPRRGIRAAPPANEGDLVIAAANSYLVSYDNISSLHALSDALCRLATGGGIRKRELYTDGDLFSLDVKRPVILSGIDPAMAQQDLVSRMVRIELHAPQQRLSETVVERMRDDRLPRIRRFLLDLACRVLGGELPDVDRPEIRQQDFAQVAEAVCRELGREPGWFTDHYVEMLAEMAEEEAEGDIMVTAIMAHMSNLGLERLEGPSEMILRTLAREMREGAIAGNLRDLPRSPREFSARFRRAMPALAKMGIDVAQDSRRNWTITRSPPEDLDMDSLVGNYEVGGEHVRYVTRGERPAPF